MEKYKPAVGKRILLLVSGLLWNGVGTMLVRFAYQWLSVMEGKSAYLLGGLGILFSLAIHHFGLLKVVDKNLARIRPMEGKRCFFSFQPWRSYLIVLFMIGMGIGLRHSNLPRPFLAVFYMAMGVALILSSTRYLKYYFKHH